jgi:CDP-diacylglycerol pyrophosphatase
MKKERVILGLVTFVVAATSALAFKNHSKDPGAKTLWTITTGQCKKTSCWTAANAGQHPCPPVTNNYRTAIKVNGVTICTVVRVGTMTN